MENQKTDVLIIGAGPAGCASASILKSKGFNVTIVEKTTFPRFVIGESLLPRCLDLLAEADLFDCVKDAGFLKKTGAMFMKNDLTCDFDFTEQYYNGSKWAWQMPRADFDKRLADDVEKKGIKILYNSAVVDVSFTEEHVTTQVSSENHNFSIESKYIIDSSGYGRVLPNLLGLNAPSNQPVRSAFFSHIADPNRPTDKNGNRIQVVVINNDVWVWIIPFSNGKTSVGVVGDLSFIDPKHSNEANFQNLIDSNLNLKNRFKTVKFSFEPKRIDAYSAAVTQFYGDRFVLTGNSTEFLDPIFSSGVTFALESGVLAAKLVAKTLNNEKVDWDESYVKYIQQGVDTFRSYINHWYDGDLQTVFFAEEIDQGIKEKICSVLAGYVWDETNPFVTKHKKAIKSLAKLINMKNGITK